MGCSRGYFFIGGAGERPERVGNPAIVKQKFTVPYQPCAIYPFLMAHICENVDIMYEKRLTQNILIVLQVVVDAVNAHDIIYNPV